MPPARRVQSTDARRRRVAAGSPVRDRPRRDVSGAAQRLRGAWSGADPDQRLACVAAAALLLTMFLPWYEKSAFDQRSGRFATDAVSAFGVVSFVEAAIFLVAAGVLVLVLARGERRAFHLPGGDGAVILAAGLWAATLIFYRVFDRPDVEGAAGTVGIQWGFFAAFVAAGTLAYAGQRIRMAVRPEPPARAARAQARDPVPPARGSPGAAPARTRAGPRGEARTEIVHSSEAVTDAASRPRRGARGRAVTRADAEQLAFDDPRDPREPALRPGETSRPRDPAPHRDEPSQPDGPPPPGEVQRARDLW